MAFDLHIQACQRCSKLFRRVRSPFCSACLDLIEEEFVVIRDYLTEHRGAGIGQVADQTGVPEKTILYLVREGRLSFGTLGEAFQCERCGALIQEGRFCDRCVGALRKEFLSSENTSGRSDDTAAPDLELYTGMHIRKPRDS
ncbi:MAG: MerR family transcriptional regulator [Clostridiaceae bacterium]|jgi:hypothetical protein|nr:MerR family transcriptional regulator [Clostridiaceae bacterium]